MTIFGIKSCAKRLIFNITKVLLMTLNLGKNRILQYFSNFTRFFF